MKKTIITIIAVLAAAIPSFAQAVDQHGHAIDTTDIYGERADSLDAAVFVSRQAGNYLSKGKDIRTEVISAAGLCKMACCNLAESFENSASVTVGFSDAVTGARQIRLLGLSGVYTQMLDETRPVMRGLSAPFGLSYVPGQWLESIQIAKGSSSVLNGVECMTGQINMEHRKPTDEKPLFINGAVMSDTKMDLNVASSLQMGYKWSTVILGHVSGNIEEHDMNG
ncbi:MAG: TonB-dependent receptor plug domain-containing protein, partial [Bacteroidales bacterium]|nr:TonB-dependent receptor plug domain-containing protein [Bacteroidales bacterium]